MEAAMSFPKLLTTEEVAAMLKISKRAVWRLVESDQLRCYKLGRRDLFIEKFLWEYFRRHNSDLSGLDDDELVEDL
jgi:excisionase family DNA binding protein